MFKKRTIASQQLPHPNWSSCGFTENVLVNNNYSQWTVNHITEFGTLKGRPSVVPPRSSTVINMHNCKYQINPGLLLVFKICKTKRPALLICGLIWDFEGQIIHDLIIIILHFKATYSVADPGGSAVPRPPPEWIPIFLNFPVM